MQWIAENWIILLLGGGMIAMHLFGHGHGGHGAARKDETADQENGLENSAKKDD